MPAYPNGSPAAAPPALARARSVLLGTFFIAALTYFAWRCSVINPQARVFSYFVLAIEVLAFVRIALGLSAIVRLPQRAWLPAQAGRSVDVFITTVDEPLEIVAPTLRAASALNYPHVTWLLDDGDRPAMRALAAEHGCRYLARRDRAEAKAGNLNHALAHATGEFVAIFDADHIADPAFLDRTLGYFRDTRIAVVQTPNEFRNTDSFDHFVRGRAKTIQGAFQYAVQGARDAINATVFCGSSAVLRRAALDAIGGFATETVNEDIHTTLRLHAHGFVTAFHAEVLATGIAAPDGPSADRQRLRWAEDAVQLVTRAHVLTYAGLTPGQRKSYAFHVISNLEGWRYAVIYALPIAMLVWGVLPVATTARAFVCFFAPYLLLATLTPIELSRGHVRPFESAVYNLARAPVIALQRRCAAPAIPACEASLAELRAADRGDAGGVLWRWFGAASVDADVPHHVEVAS